MGVVDTISHWKVVLLNFLVLTRCKYGVRCVVQIIGGCTGVGDPDIKKGLVPDGCLRYVGGYELFQGGLEVARRPSQCDFWHTRNNGSVDSGQIGQLWIPILMRKRGGIGVRVYGR
jgi:hypothetical protein